MLTINRNGVWFLAVMSPIEFVLHPNDYLQLLGHIIILSKRQVNFPVMKNAEIIKTLIHSCSFIPTFIWWASVENSSIWLEKDVAQLGRTETKCSYFLYIYTHTDPISQWELSCIELYGVWSFDKFHGQASTCQCLRFKFPKYLTFRLFSISLLSICHFCSNYHVFFLSIYCVFFFSN